MVKAPKRVDDGEEKTIKGIYQLSLNSINKSIDIDSFERPISPSYGNQFLVPCDRPADIAEPIARTPLSACVGSF
jgi:hypothetical protein